MFIPAGTGWNEGNEREGGRRGWERKVLLPLRLECKYQTSSAILVLAMGHEFPSSSLFSHSFDSVLLTGNNEIYIYKDLWWIFIPARFEMPSRRVIVLDEIYYTFISNPWHNWRSTDNISFFLFLLWLLVFQSVREWLILRVLFLFDPLAMGNRIFK